MKKHILLLFIIFSTLVTYGQVIATGTYKSYYKTYQNIDYLFVFNGIDNSTELIFNGQTSSMDSVKWYYFSDPTTPISLQSPAVNTNVEDGTGYILDILDAGGNHKKYTIWVIDYKKYLPVFTSFIPEFKPAQQCDGLMLDLVADVPLIQYKSIDGITYTIDRQFTLAYNTKTWSGTWGDEVLVQNVKLPKARVEVFTAPLCDTKFTLEGDQFARDLQLDSIPKFESELYAAVAVECHITTTAATRNELHEGERPSTTKVQSGSAPLDIMFESNANVPVADFYQWQIFKEGSLLFNRTDQDQRYTFTESGNYMIKLVSSNAYCSYADSVIIDVSTSYLEAPHVFTPDNGDNLNDEFRVAYKSITSFKCWVFNRWGHQIYFWTDIQKGWDGTINGKPAKPGAYLYIIEAVGADGKEHNKKGMINLLRGKQD